MAKCKALMGLAVKGLSRSWAFQRAIDQGRASPLTSPKWGSDTQMCRFSQKFRPKTIKSLLQVSLSKTSSSTVVAQSTTYRTVSNIFAGDDSVPVKFGPKGTDLQ